MTFSAPFPVLESVRHRIATIEYWSNQIIHIKLDDNEELLLEDSVAQYNYLREKFDGKNKHLLLIEPGLYTSISAEARQFSTQPENNELTAASAVIIRSLAHRLLINFMINFTQKSTMKMRIFESKEKAIDWLLTFK